MTTKQLIIDNINKEKIKRSELLDLVEDLNSQINVLDTQKDILINERNPHLNDLKKIEVKIDNLEDALKIVEEVEIMPIGRKEIK